jgi:hypothetical protein
MTILSQWVILNAVTDFCFALMVVVLSFGHWLLFNLKK